MVMCSNTLEDAQQAIIVAENLPGVLYCTVGVHPHHAKVFILLCSVLYCMYVVCAVLYCVYCIALCCVCCVYVF